MNEAPPSGRRPAGFWIRTLALGIDVVLFFLVLRSLGLIANRVWGTDGEESSIVQLTIVMFTFLFTVLYTTLLHAATGQTVGKLVVGVRVLTVDGGRVPVGAAFLRYFAYYASVGTLGFGYLMAGLRHDKRALHDLIAGTRVDRMVRRDPVVIPATDALTPPRAL